jgi:superfamily I DNA/RNA helicase
LEQLTSGQLVLNGVKNILQRYKEILAECALYAPLTPSVLLEAIAPDSPETRVFRELILAKITDKNGPGDMANAVRMAVTQPEMPEDGKFVRIMSLQKSKGLTSKMVIVSSCIEGLIPVHPPKEETPAEQAETLREQRRLFYVAMTRPTKILVISSFVQISAATAKQAGIQLAGHYQNKTVTSRLISELGPSAPSAITRSSWKQNGYA